MKLKNLGLAFGFSALVLCGCSQSKTVKELIHNCEQEEGVTSLDLSLGFSQKKASQKSKISKIKLLSFEQATNIKFNAQLMKNLEKEGFESLMSVRDKQDQVEILAKTDGDFIQELVLLAGEKDNEKVLIYVEGRIDMRDQDAVNDILQMSGSEKG